MPQSKPASATAKPRVMAFIDSQNLNRGIKSEGWNLDFRKFRQYLRHKYGVSRALVFIGFIEGNEELYDTLKQNGFELIYKPTMELPDESVKGNVDTELVLHAMIEAPNYDKAIIVSGDGDFFCLVEYLEQQQKLLKVIAPNRHFSSLLRKYHHYILRLDKLRKSLEYTHNKNKQPAASENKKDQHDRSA